MENTIQPQEINKKKEVIGNLFDTIHYTSQEQLNTFLDTMNEDQAIYCIKEALNYCHLSGMFSMTETEAISKSIRVLFTK
jgi:hypothetical protein